MARTLAGFMCLTLLVAAAAPARAQETLRIKGSDTIGGKLTPELAEDYRARGGRLGFVVEALGSATAFVGLLDGSADLGESSRPINEKEMDSARQLGVTLRETVIGYDGVAVIVNPSNPVSSLTIAQLSDVFTGKIRSWKRLGGKDEPIMLIGRPAYSGTHTFFRDRVVRRGNSKGPEDFDSAITVVEENGAILQAVASKGGAVGYVGLGWLDSRVKALRVAAAERGAGVAPSVETVRAGSYPLYRPLLMYLPSAPKPAAAEFLRFVLSKEGSAIVARNGFVPPDVPGPSVIFPAAVVAANAVQPGGEASAPAGAPVAETRPIAAAPAPSAPVAGSPAQASRPAAPGPAGSDRQVFRVFFPAGSVKPGADAAAVIERAAAQARSEGVRVVVAGHADSTGPAAANARVSRARADVVASMLRQAGAPADRMSVVSSSSDAPLATNDTPAGRSRNRRVDIEIVLR
jgi:phosphate transport system substrate-binding protein